MNPSQLKEQSLIKLSDTIDVHITLDQEIVMFHDPHLGKFKLALQRFISAQGGDESSQIERRMERDEFKLRITTVLLINYERIKLLINKSQLSAKRLIS
jgi:predicted double-glycine peptidase